MSHQPRDPEFRGIIEEAAAGWAPQSQQLPVASRATASPAASPNTETPPPSSAPELGRTSGAYPESRGWDSNAVWQVVLQNLGPDFSDLHFPRHILTESLGRHPVVRGVEWNPYRRVVGFSPRTAHDFASVMIYICGQISPNPCRNCLLQNGPFERCVLAPSAVLADTSLRHACANCTYQKQFKKCNNEPISEQELLRSRSLRLVPRPDYGRPKITTSKRAYTSANADPTPERPKRPREQEALSPQGPTDLPNTSPDPAPYSFAEKVRLAKKWSPAAKLKMKAELLQWKAALAAAEAETMAESEAKAQSSQSTATEHDLATPGSNTAIAIPQAPHHNDAPSSSFLMRTPMVHDQYPNNVNAGVDACGRGSPAYPSDFRNNHQGSGSGATSPSMLYHPHPRTVHLSLQTSGSRNNHREVNPWGSPAQRDHVSGQVGRMQQDSQASAGAEGPTEHDDQESMDTEQDEDESHFIKPPM